MDLTLYGSVPRSRHLLTLNPHLKKLTWYGEVPFSGVVSELQVNALLALSESKGEKDKGLEELCLRQWDVSEGQLVRILQGWSKSLVRLTLKHIQGLDDLKLPPLTQETVPPTNPTGGKVLNEIENAGGDDDEEVVEKGQSEMSGTDQWKIQRPLQHEEQERQEGLILERLQELTIDCEWVENRALLQFITECCPNLTNLHLSDALMDDKAMMGRLEDTLAARQQQEGGLQKTMTSVGIQYRFDANSDTMASCYTD